jgi:hypothetical protein
MNNLGELYGKYRSKFSRVCFNNLRDVGWCLFDYNETERQSHAKIFVNQDECYHKSSVQLDHNRNFACCCLTDIIFITS